MRFWDYLKRKAPVLLLNGAALLVLSLFLLLLDTMGTAVILIVVVWILVLAAYLAVDFLLRRKYFLELLSILDELDQKYLITEIAKPGRRLEDRVYWEVLRRSNKSVIETIHRLENSQKEYKEYIESWIHEVKSPITAAHFICENRKDETAGRMLPELDAIENEVEKVLYYARMEQVDRDYLIHPVNLRETVLSVIRAEKRHLIQCGIQIDLDMKDEIVSTDEKWVEFMIKQIFSNSMKYRRETGPRLTIRAEKGKKQKSLVIEDNGRGVAPEDLGRIFDKGFTGKNGRMTGSRATGMGLYLCRRLCEKLGIGISCESEPGQFTRMILTFPDSDFNRLTEDSPLAESR